MKSVGRIAERVIEFNDQAIKGRLKASKGQPQGEWRIRGVDGLVLVTQPTGAGTFYVFRLREAAGVEDISIHDMRRAISNWLKDQGISREVRDLILNHKDPSVTEEHYSATARMEKQVRVALQVWGDHVWEITGQGKGADNVVKLRA
jgi:integrase